jgi:hypothetical protein
LALRSGEAFCFRVRLQPEIPMAEKTLPVEAENAKRLLATERRAWVRFPSDQEISCQRPTLANRRTAETAWLGRLRDISAEGMGLRINRSFERGTLLIVDLSTKAEEQRHLLVRVVHATLERKGHWLIGCAFAEPLSEQQLRAFLQE